MLEERGPPASDRVASRAELLMLLICYKFVEVTGGKKDKVVMNPESVCTVSHA